MTKILNQLEIAQFTGSEQWYRHFLNHKVLYTEGARYVAEIAGAYWLLDEIALIKPHDKAVAAEEFQAWKLTVADDQTAILICDDGNGRVVYTKSIPYTDFPVEGITLWFVNNTILLPSEY